MSVDQVDRTVVTQTSGTAAIPDTVQTESRRVVRSGPGASEMSRRVVILGFGLIRSSSLLGSCCSCSTHAKQTASCRASST